MSRQLLQQQWVLRNIWWHRNRKPLLLIYYHLRKGFHTCLAFYHDYPLSQWSGFTQGFAPTYPIFCWWSRSDVIMLNLSHHTHLHCNRVWWKSQNYDLPVGSSKGERGMEKKRPLLDTKSAVRCTKKDFSLKCRLALHSTPIARYVFVWWLIHMVFLDHPANTIKYHVARMNKD